MKKITFIILITIVSILLFRIALAITWTGASNDLSNVPDTSAARSNLGIHANANTTSSASTGGILSSADWTTFNNKLSTSTNLGILNFTTTSVGQWVNNGLYLTTSTGLGTINFTTTSVSQWKNDAFVTWNRTCGGTDKVSSVSATGTIVCTTDQTGAGANGTVTTSTVVSANYFPIWNADNGTGLNGTSTLFVSGLSLFTGGSFNASGTITQNGTTLLQTANNLSDLTATSTARINIGFNFLATSPITVATTTNGNVTYACATCLTTSTGLSAQNFGTIVWVTSSSVSGLGNIVWGSATGSISIKESPTFTGLLSADKLNATTSVITALTSSTGITFNNATGTNNLQVASFTDTGIGAALVLSSSGGVFSAYGGASACGGRQAVTTISAVGATTCADVGVSTSTANNWTATQTFSNSTVGLSATIVNATTSVLTDKINATTSIITALTSSTGITFTNATGSGSLAIPLLTVGLNGSGTIGIENTTGTFSFFASSTQWILNPEQCDIDFVLEVASSSTQVQEDDYLHTFRATSTITHLYSVHKNDGDTATFNIIWATTSTRSSASSTSNHLFNGAGVGGNVTSTATSSPNIYPGPVNFASSTVNSGSIMRLITSVVSSTQWGITLCHIVNP